MDLGYRTKINLCLLFSVIAISAGAQLNIRVGYNLGAVSPEIHHQIYQDYNQDRDWLTQTYTNFNTINGLQVGLRYQFDKYLGLELTLHNQFHHQTASGVDPATDKDNFREMGFRYSSLGLGFENFYGPISLGVSFNYDWIRFNTKHTDRPSKYAVMTDNGWSSHFFIGYNFKGNNFLHLTLRPYLHIPWSTFNLGGLQDELNPDSQVENLAEDYRAIGLMLIFYNGY